jgi:heme/copper-type cytochrome/quinol oxidase subunit 3
MSQAATETILARPPHEAGHGAGSVGPAGMWTFLATDAMGFGGMFIAYGVLRVRADAWPDPRARLAIAPAAAMTFALLASSLTISLAARAGSRRGRLGWMLATLALGIGFLAGAVVEDLHLAGGPARMGFSSDLFASTFYALTGFHGLHVLAGVAALVLMLRRSVTARSIEVMGLYWHFVDLAWMPIFTFLYLLPAR